MILALGVISVIASIVTLTIFPFWGIVITVLTKPIIDTTWNVSFGGVNLLEIISVAFPLLLLPRLLYRGKDIFIDNRLKWIALGYFVSYSLGSLILFLDRDYRTFAELWMRSLNGYVGFFLFACFFRHNRDFKILLLALIIAGLFPLFMSIYQNVTGVIWQSRQTVGLVRRVGLYHDGFNLRLYSFQTLAAILLFRSHFKPARRCWNLLLLLYALCWLYVVFNLYSKAAFLIIGVWWVT